MTEMRLTVEMENSLLIINHIKLMGHNTDCDR